MTVPATTTEQTDFWSKLYVFFNLPHSVLITVVKKKSPAKTFWDFNGIETHYLRDTGAMFYRLSYEASLEGWALDDITQKDLVREGPGKSFMIHVMCYKMHGNHGDFKDAQWVGLLHGGKAGFRELYSSIPEGFPIFFWVSFLFFALGLGLGLWLGLRFEPVGSRSGASSIYPRYMKRVKWCVYDINHIYELRIKNMKVIFAVGKQLKQLQTKPRKYSEASTEFEPMTSAIPVQYSTDWAMNGLLDAGQEPQNFSGFSLQLLLKVASQLQRLTRCPVAATLTNFCKIKVLTFTFSPLFTFNAIIMPPPPTPS